MGYLIYAGLKGREDSRTAIAAGDFGGESLIFGGEPVSLLTLALCLHIRNFRRQVKSMRSEFLPYQLAFITFRIT